MMADDLHHLLDGSFQVVVDYYVIGEPQANGFLIEGLLQALSNPILGVAPPT